MNIFTEICLYVLPTVLIWHLFAIFFFDDSKFQKYRFRKALDQIHEYIMNNTQANHPPIEMNIIYKNKKFAIGIIKTEVNNHYATYQIFINGSEAACYHKMKKSDLRSGYYYAYEEINKRHRNEVSAIVYAACSLLKQKDKPKKEKKNGYTEYSYFK
jgi:hypothetical protein